MPSSCLLNLSLNFQRKKVKLESETQFMLLRPFCLIELFSFVLSLPATTGLCIKLHSALDKRNLLLVLVLLREKALWVKVLIKGFIV